MGLNVWKVIPMQVFVFLDLPDIVPSFHKYCIYLLCHFSITFLLFIVLILLTIILYRIQ